MDKRLKYMQTGIRVIPLILVAFSVGCGTQYDNLELPQIERFSQYRAASFTEAAHLLHQMGRERARALLLKAARQHQEDRAVILLCRMLFAKREGLAGRRPGLGGAGFLGTTTYEDWPNEPIEMIDGVPFVIVSGYVLTGVAEPAEAYLDYCEKECEWTGYPYEVPNESQLHEALAKLLKLGKWKNSLRPDDISFLSSQIN